MKNNERMINENSSIADEFLNNNYLNILISYLENCNDYEWMFIRDRENDTLKLFDLIK